MLKKQIPLSELIQNEDNLKIIITIIIIIRKKNYPKNKIEIPS